MRFFIFCSFFLLTLNVFALEAGWTPIAETNNCQGKIKVFGKEGESYVVAVQGDKEIKLFSKDGSAFSKESMKSTEFSAKDIQFIQPSYVEANPPKIVLTQNNQKQDCRMVLK